MITFLAIMGAVNLTVLIVVGLFWFGYAILGPRLEQWIE